MTRKKTGTTTGLMTPKSKVNLSLTGKAMETIETMMKETGLNKSALFEGILTGNIPFSSPNSQVSKENVDDNTQVKEVFDIGNHLLNQELEQQKKLIQNLEEEVSKQHNLVSEKEQINNSLKDSLKEKEDTIKTLENKLKNQESEYTNKIKDISNNHDRLEDKEKELHSLKHKLEEANKNLKLKDDEIKQLSETQNLLDIKVKIIAELTQKIAHLEQQITEVNNDQSLQAKLTYMEQRAQEVKLQYDNLQTELTNKNNSLNELNQQLSQQENIINQLRQQIQTQKDTIQQLEIDGNNVKSYYQQHQRSIETKLNGINEQQKLTIHHLQSRVSELESTATIGEQMLNKWRSKLYN